MAHQTDKQYRMADLFGKEVFGKEVTDQNGMFFGPQLGTNYYKIFMPKINAACHAINNYDAMQDRVKELEQERDQLATRVDQLAMENFFILQNANAEYALSIAPATKAILAEIQAKAIEDLRFPSMLRKMWSSTEVQSWLEGVAEIKRQQASAQVVEEQI